MTELVGILNITPDSFSDGGQFTRHDAALKQCKKMLAEGATIIDIGAESTRPDAKPLTAKEEWKRLEKILPQLINSFPQATVSLDSYHLENIQKALKIGVNWVNFVSSEIDNNFIQLMTKYPEAKIVIMHNLGIPASKTHLLPQSCNPTDEVNQWFSQKINALIQHIDKNRIILDPGIGFGKSPEQSLQLINDAKLFKQHNLPLLYGHSRKSFLQLPSSSSIEEKDKKTAYFSAQLSRNKVEYLRVHNIHLNMQSLNHDTI